MRSGGVPVPRRREGPAGRGSVRIARQGGTGEWARVGGDRGLSLSPSLSLPFPLSLPVRFPSFPCGILIIRKSGQLGRAALTLDDVELSLAGWHHSPSGFGRPGVHKRELLSQKALARKLAAAGPGAHLQ